MQSRLLRTKTTVGVFLSVLISISGCGASTPGPVPAGPKGTVTGAVLLDGKPVPAGCVVTFTNEKVNVPAMATTAADGSYSLEIVGTLQIPVGLYKVTVKAAPKPAMSDAEYEKFMQDQQKNAGADKAPAASESTIPLMYANSGTTSLKYEVKEGANTYDIKLVP